MNLSDRAYLLRNRMLATPEMCIERGLYMTESYQTTEGYPDTIRRAKALEKILNQIG